LAPAILDQSKTTGQRKAKETAQEDDKGECNPPPPPTTVTATNILYGRWTKEEDEKLRIAIATKGAHSWKVISEEFLDGKRSDVQCLHRWNKVLHPGLVKGPWTREEDAIIMSCVQNGIMKWSEVAEKVPGRIGKQCRERWYNHLNPALKKGGWTEEEDGLLLAAQRKWGNAWTKIAKEVPGRSENAVKNR